ncbi:hypothetical protein V8D89_010369 [Ganoderma adspersum]
MFFAFTFRAFGDIVAAANLAHRVSNALSSSSGFTYDYQYLIQELDALAHILQITGATARTAYSNVKRCRKVVERLWNEVRKYQKALGSGSTAKGRVRTRSRSTTPDPFGTNTVLPFTLCESAEQLDAIITLVAAKQLHAVCEEARARLDGDNEDLLSYLGWWRQTGPGSAMSKVLQIVVCPECERDAGPTLPSPRGQFQVTVIGCEPEAPVLRCTLHHPSFTGCNAGCSSIYVAAARMKEPSDEFCNAVTGFFMQHFGIRDTRKCPHAHPSVALVQA